MRTMSRLTRRLLPLALALTFVPVATPASASGTPATTYPVGGLVASGARVQAGGDYGIRTVAVLPESVDLRADAPAVADQGDVSSCVAWSIAYSIMGYYVHEWGGTGTPYAPMYLYTRNVGGGAPTRGLVAEKVLADVESGGVDTQDDYWQGTTNYRQKATAAEVANAGNYRITGWSTLFNGAGQGSAARTAIMEALAAGKPVGLGIPVYRDFLTGYSGGLYTRTSGTNLGGHMVTVFGYDSAGVIIRNSWGTGWGEDGDGHLSWKFIEKVASSAYTVDGITTPAKPVAVKPHVASLSTRSASTGATVTLRGSNFATATGVDFAGSAATVRARATNILTVSVPAGVSGTVELTVTNPAGTSAAVPFTVSAPAAATPAQSTSARSTSAPATSAPATPDPATSAPGGTSTPQATSASQATTTVAGEPYLMEPVILAAARIVTGSHGTFAVAAVTNDLDLDAALTAEARS